MRFSVRRRRDVAWLVLSVTTLCVAASAAVTWLATRGLPLETRAIGNALGIGIPAVLASACSLAFAIQIRKTNSLRVELARLAWLDELTGVFNRRAFYAQAERMMALARRNRIATSILLIDIDHLKLVNDTFGHEIGDKVIVGFSRTLSEYVRTSDVTARIGGDEFAILLYDSDLDASAELAERICNAIAQSSLVYVSDEVDVTASIGVARIENNSDLPAAMRRADKSLYSAKEKGRNRVEVASDGLKLASAQLASRSDAA